MTLKSPTITEERAVAKKLLDPIPPGEILLEEFMKPLGISINGLARDIDVPPNRISEIVNGKRAITADTALRRGKYFGVSPELWLDLQSDYDLRMMRRSTWPMIEPTIRRRAA
jgi:addiction module HigA family antidote